MERAKFEIETEIRDPIHVYYLGDTHIGNATTNERAIMKAVDIIKNDPTVHKYVILMGDYCDFITHTGDKRFDPLEIMKDFSVKDLRNLPQAQANRFLGFMEPIKDFVIGVISGNHEESYIRHNTYDVYKYICDAFPNAKPLREFAFYRLSLKTKNLRSHVDLVLRHGGGGYGGSTKGYPLNKLLKVFNGQEGDIHVMGHIHRMAHTSTKYVYLNTTGTAIVEGYRYYGVNGTFLDSYVEGETNYSESRGGEPITRGMLMSEISLGFQRVNRRNTLIRNIKMEDIVL